MFAGDSRQRLVLRNELLIDQLRGYAESRGGGTLTHTSLEHPQLAALNGELNVTHVLVVSLQFAHDRQELFVGFGILVSEFRKRLRVSDARNNVFTLRVHEVITVNTRVPGRGVAGEANTGAGGLPHVSKHHRLNVDSGAQVIGNAFAATVNLRAFSVPGAEHGFHSHVHLGARILRELFPGLVQHNLLVRFNQRLPVFRGQFSVRLFAEVFFQLFEGISEQISINILNGLAKHLDQAPVGIPRETLIARDFN